MSTKPAIRKIVPKAAARAPSPPPVEETPAAAADEAVVEVADDHPWTEIETFDFTWDGKPKIASSKDDPSITFGAAKIVRRHPVTGEPMKTKKGASIRPSLELPEEVSFPYGLEAGKSQKYESTTVKAMFDRENPDHVKFTDEWLSVVEPKIIKLIEKEKYALGKIDKFTETNNDAFKSALYVPTDKGVEVMTSARSMYMTLFDFPENKERGFAANQTRFYLPGIDEPIPWSKLRGMAFKGIPVIKLDEIKRAVSDVRCKVYLKSMVITWMGPIQATAARASKTASSYAQRNPEAAAALREAYLAGMKAGASSATNPDFRIGADGADKIAARYGGAAYGGADDGDLTAYSAPR